MTSTVDLEYKVCVYIFCLLSVRIHCLRLKIVIFLTFSLIQSVVVVVVVVVVCESLNVVTLYLITVHL